MREMRGVICAISVMSVIIRYAYFVCNMCNVYNYKVCVFCLSIS